MEGGFLDLENVGSDQSLRTSRENPLAIGWHGESIVKECKSEKVQEQKQEETV
jgi:hypothetical protein